MDQATPVTGQAAQWPAQLALRSSHADPQNAIYISPEDTLYLVCWSSVAVTLTANMRILPPDGPINIGLLQFAVSAARSPQVFTLPAGEGFVLGAVLQAFTTNNLRRGQTYCVLMFLRGSITGSGQYTQVLCAGYPTAQTPLFYPLGRVGDSFAGRGNIRSITGTQPALGADISETVPAGAVWQLNSFRIILVTAVTVANRNLVMTIDDGVNVLIEIVDELVATANGSFFYDYACGMPAASLLGTRAYFPLPFPFTLAAGYRIRTVTNGIQAGDQLLAPQYQVEEWIQT